MRPNSYQELLDEHGEGLHRLGCSIDDLGVEPKGYGLLQSGRAIGMKNDGGYAYFETQSALGRIVEAGFEELVDHKDRHVKILVDSSQ